jgi:hypothetical protein
VTATQQSSRWLSEHARWGRRGGQLNTVRITSTGRVIVYQIHLIEQQATPGETVLWPTQADSDAIGTVDPDNASAFVHAETLLREAGWQRIASWTTVARYPTARIERAPKRPARTVRVG